MYDFINSSLNIKYQCYDMRFPQMSIALTENGAEILTYPSAFFFGTGAYHWEVLLRSRAIENQCYVIAAAQTGNHSLTRKSWGHSLVCFNINLSKKCIPRHFFHSINTCN